MLIRYLGIILLGFLLFSCGTPPAGWESADFSSGGEGEGEVPHFYKRHFTHFTPRDFDLSPYFRIVKPTLEKNFDFHNLHWQEEQKGTEA